jgi:hypothetical protein
MCSRLVRPSGGLALLFTGLLILMPGTSTADTTVNINVGPPPPIVLAAPPPLVVVPGVPVVSYAPAITFDLFFFDSRWYYSHGGHWYVGRSYKGPWTYVAVGKLPRSIVVVPAQYYKVPPGHLKKIQGGGPPARAKGKGKGHS